MKAAIMILLSLLTVACATKQPKTLGIPLTQWSQLSTTQQETVIKNYHLSTSKRYANQPVITHESIPNLNNALPSKKTVGSSTQAATTKSSKRSASWLQLNGS